MTLIDSLNKLLQTVKKEPGLSSSMLDAALEELDSLRHKARRREEAEEKLRLQKEEEERKAAELEKEAERIRSVTSMELPLDWENVFSFDKRSEGIHADSAADGLILSLSNLGKVDIEYISAITGIEYKDVISALKGSIFQNPETWNEIFYEGWETAEEYLSGNLMRKWRAAKKANVQYKGYFHDNLNALKKVMPEKISSEEIYVTLGSPWIPVDVIDDFIAHLFSPDRFHYLRHVHTVHDPITGSWEIKNKSLFNQDFRSTDTWGTGRIHALTILEKTLNMKTIAVKDEVVSLTSKSGFSRKVNTEESILALEKQQKMIGEFQSWVWQDPKRKAKLEKIFEENFNCVKKRNFDGSFLTFPTMRPDAVLFPYQKDAVARILFSPNTLLAHDVGSGKTYVMIAAGMEMRRMELAEKILYAVPNNIVGQWKNIFLSLYPDAKLLCVEPKHFTPQNKQKTMERIRDEEFDAIIMAQSCLERIGLSRDQKMLELEELKETIKSKIAEKGSGNTKQLQAKKEKLDEKLRELLFEMYEIEDEIFFDDLGVDRLFVDEAHNYKNLPLETKVDKVLGISSTGSKKCADMLEKVRFVQKANNGGGVVFATGTPITNSITDIFVMQKYLQEGELTLLDLQNFDSWIGMFAEKKTEFEVDVDTSAYRLATRFSKFHNLPELTSLISSFADFHALNEENGIPRQNGYLDSVIAKTPDFENYLKSISARADDVRKGMVSRKEDNMLKITTDGRKAALDLRLADTSATFTYQSKVARCAENVFEIYQNTALQKSAQLIFCDSSTPKAGFHIYGELKNLLVAMGIPEEHVAFVHDAESERARAKLFQKVRHGEVRILLGSTFKLGMGVNVQDKLIALHHLDIPWRPADMIQREGRILRQGNENKTVTLFRYITEGSFDAYSWQLLETKARFIADLLSGCVTQRSSQDIDDTVLNYAEVKALAVGNPLIKERVECANELARYHSLKRKSEYSYRQAMKESLELPGKIKAQKERIQKCKADLDYLKENQVEYTKEERMLFRQEIFNALQNNVLAEKEKELLEYAGFRIILPAGMRKEKPYLFLCREGKYYVEMGNTEMGTVPRIDHVLSSLPQHLKMLSDDLKKFTERKKAVLEAISNPEDYSDTIRSLEEKLNQIDEKLGVSHE